MGYCAILIPNNEEETEEKDVGLFESITGKLMSGVKTGGLSISNATTLLKNTANLIIENSDKLANKFSGIALTQLLVNGQITNETAFGYLTQGFPNALNQTAIAMGFQSVEQLKTALKSKNGVNVQQFISAFENAGNALLSFNENKKTRDNVEGFTVIEIDATLSDSRSYQAETPDRRVQSGQTYQEYLHNLPDIISLECVLQNNRQYSIDDFEDIMLNLRDSKKAFNIILGDETKENVVLTNFSPVRETWDGFQYSLELKKINVGSIFYGEIERNTSVSTSLVGNYLFKGDTKTDFEYNKGYINVGEI